MNTGAFKPPTPALLEPLLAAWEALVAARKPARGGLGADEVAGVLRARRAPALTAALLPWRRHKGPWTRRLVVAVLMHVRLHPLPDGRALDYFFDSRRYGGNLWRIVEGVAAAPAPRKPRGKPPRTFKAFGGTFTLAQLMKRSVVPWHRLYERIVVRGWDPERACKEPVHQTGIPTVAFPDGAPGGLIAPGEVLGIPELAARTGQPEDRLRKREAAGLAPLAIIAPERRVRDRLVDDLTGRRFGLLVVQGLSPRRWGKQHRLWVCQCDCGSPAKEILGFALLRSIKPTRSCGCLRAEANAARQKRRARRYEVFGELLTIAELSFLAEVPQPTLRRRLRRNVPAAIAAFGRECIQPPPEGGIMDDITHHSSGKAENLVPPSAGPPETIAKRTPVKRIASRLIRVRFPGPLLQKLDELTQRAGEVTKRKVSRAAVARALVRHGIDAAPMPLLTVALGNDPVRHRHRGAPGRSIMVRIRLAAAERDRAAALVPPARRGFRAPFGRDAIVRALVQVGLDAVPVDTIAQMIRNDPVRRGRRRLAAKETTR